MGKRTRRVGGWIAAAVALSLFLSVSCAADTVIFDSLNGNTTYGTPTSGWCVSGGSTPNCGPETLRWIAAPFQPVGNFTLTQVELDLGYNSGTNAATVNLVNSSGGLPGSTVLESWNLTSLATFNTANPPSSILVTLAAVGAVPLNGGAQYWLEVTAGGASSTTLDLWATSSLNTNGTVSSLDGGSTWINPLSVLPGSTGALTAFQVRGTPAATTVPEPDALFLLITGLLGIAGAARLKWLFSPPVFSLLRR